MVYSTTSTPTRLITFNNRVLVISQVRDDKSLYRVMSGGVFNGYVQRRDGEFYRVDGSSISGAKFEAICLALK